MPITGAVLAWAIDQSGLSVDDLAAKTGYEVDNIRAWIEGDPQPSVGELRKLATAVHRPIAIFFRPQPPSEVAVPAGLRRMAGAANDDLSPKQLRLVRRVRRLQRLSRALLEEQGTQPIRIPELAARTGNTVDSGQALREWVGVSATQQLEWGSAKDAFDGWRSGLESRGLLVIQLSMGEELRGMSLPDDLAPVIAINTADNYQARTFTSFHELAHLGSRTESSCGERTGGGSATANLERWCEEVASAALLPPGVVRQFLADMTYAPESDTELVKHVADSFHVSLRATALALIRSQFVERSVYYEIEQQAPILDRQKGFARGGARRAPEQRLSELGNRAMALVLAAFQAGRLSERDARAYLRLDGHEVDELASRFGVARPEDR